MTAPAIGAVHFTRPYVDISSEDSIGLWVEAHDSQSGIGRVEADLTGPNGRWHELAFESVTPFLMAATPVQVPPSTPAGRYRVSRLSVADRAGNRVVLDAAALEAAGIDANFDVFEGPDVEGPELTAYSLSPETLDTSANPGSVRFSLTATDDLSGVEDAAALIRRPDSDDPLCFPCGHRVPSVLASGTIFDGIWTEDLPLPRFATAGTYAVTAVVLYDRAGNETVYDHEELEDLGYPVEFTQIGGGDSEPPEIVDFWMNPGALQTSSGNGTIEFFLRVQDDLSGVGETADSVFEQMRVDFHPPHAFEWWFSDAGTTQVSGTQLDGVWRFRVTLPREAETGTWRIPALVAADHAGNETLLRGAELNATGWDLTVENLP